MPKLLLPDPTKVFEEDGQTYVRARSGIIGIEEWQVVQYLYHATDDELRAWAQAVSPMPDYQREMDLYGEPETHTGYVAFIRLMIHRWPTAGLTVPDLEALP